MNGIRVAQTDRLRQTPDSFTLQDLERSGPSTLADIQDEFLSEQLVSLERQLRELLRQVRAGGAA